MNDPIKLLHFGLGPIGLEVARLAAERPWLRAVAAVDFREDLQGKSLREIWRRWNCRRNPS